MCTSHCVCTIGTYGCVQWDVGMLMCVYALESVDVSVWVCSRKLGGTVRQRGRTREEGRNRRAQGGGKIDTDEELE